MGFLVILWLLVIAAGVITTPFGLAMGSAEPATRRAYGVAVAVALAIVGGGVAVGAIAGGWNDSGALPWLIAATIVPLALAGAMIAAVRDEGRRGAMGWVPTAALAAFPVFLFFAAVVLFFDAS